MTREQDFTQPFDFKELEQDFYREHPRLKPYLRFINYDGDEDKLWSALYDYHIFLLKKFYDKTVPTDKDLAWVEKCTYPKCYCVSGIDKCIHKITQ